MSSFDHDLFVIGGGSGGVRAARMAAQAGASVALAEDDRMGGTCVIRGCVPKKLMVYASSFREMPEEARAYGWDFGAGRFDWTVLRTRLHAELDRLEGVYRGLLSNSGVTVHNQRATVEGPHEVRLADGSLHSAAHILIATGGRPERPDIPNAGRGLISDDLFGLEELPKSLLVIGGGFIACEMAGIFNGLGTEVTQYVRSAQILRGFDDEARGFVAEGLRGRGINLHCGTTLVAMGPPDQPLESGVEGTLAGNLAAGMGVPLGEGVPVPAAGPGALRVKSSTGEDAVHDAVLFATGRAPNTRDLGLEALGVELDRNGAIVVDDHSQTAVPSVYALGDVTDRVNLTPVAIRDAMAFVDTVFRGKPTPVDHDLIPVAVFTQPELGTIGLTEDAAAEREKIEVYTSSFRPMRAAFAERGREGPGRQALMKLVVSQQSRRVLGCHIVAPEAGEMIQLAGIAVKMGATKEDFDRVCAVHPTMAEELVTMRSPVRTR